MMPEERRAYHRTYKRQWRNRLGRIGMETTSTADARGLWQSVRIPASWRYKLDLQCAICEITAHFTGMAEEGTGPDVGPWRIVHSPSRGHADPLAEDAVVCGRPCAEQFVAEQLDRLFW